MAAIVGAAGLAPSLAAARAGKRVLLANKEALVMSGNIFLAAARASGAVVLPIDSEHNAVHQCLRGGRAEEVDRVWLTASGGPFLHTPLSHFSSITVEEALNHPTWKMGRRITIDSATLMNKGLPILYALTYPERVKSDMHFPVMDLRHLDFCPPDVGKFPCLRLAYEAAEAGGAKPVALNAADEVAVAAFLDRQIGFQDIPRVIQGVLAATPTAKLESIEDVLEADAEARGAASRQVSQTRSVSPVTKAAIFKGES